MQHARLIIPSDLKLDEEQRTKGQVTYLQSLTAAREYDGTEAAEIKFYELVHAFEACACEIAARNAIDITDPLIRDVLEQSVARMATSDNTALNVDGLLALAIESFGRKVDAGTIEFITIKTELHFLPTHGSTSFVPNDEEDHPWEVRGVPRTSQMIQALNRNGIYTDDIVVFKGANVPGVMRRHPYSLIQIPRLDREMLICDEVQQAIFIGIGLRGPEFWATHGKEQLGQDLSIFRITGHGNWMQRAAKVLFEANPPRPKVKLASRTYQPIKRLLTEDLILTKALEYAMTHNGDLPERDSGDVDGLPGETWNHIGISVRNSSNGLTREGLTGLPALFRLFGLITIGMSKNPVIIRNGCDSLRMTGSHGLVEGNDFQLTDDLILGKAVEYAMNNGDRLPTVRSGEVDGFPGQTWQNWNASVIQGCHGLEPGRKNGISGLFRSYGLKMAKTANPEKIRMAFENLTTTGSHGLEVVDEMALSETLILRKALEYADKRDGKLPSKGCGDVEGLPGQKWDRWNDCIHSKSNGLTREGVAGLSELFQQYGLKIGRLENPVAVQSAIEKLKATGDHGLQLSKAMKLSEDLILGKALEFAINNNGKLPTPLDGDIDGYPGQNWSTWHSAIGRKTSGVSRHGIGGLPALFRAYGLKYGRQNNLAVIRQAWDRLQQEGCHGLVFDERLLSSAQRPAVARCKLTANDPNP